MFAVGQRWYSEGEPELGLGLIQNIEQKYISVLYPLCGEIRTYNKQSSPLKRYKIDIGETLITEAGEELIVDDREELNGVIFYKVNNDIVPEMNLQSKIDLHGPQDRILVQNFDSNKFFNLRYQTYLEKRHYEGFKHKGLLGPKIRLIPHQMYVVNEVLNMSPPKAMLCDEVGLGKTIEACLVLHGLIQREMVASALIVVPESLTNQWFVELYKKFNLRFSLASLSGSATEFLESDFIIISTKTLDQTPQIMDRILKKHWDMLIIDESHQIRFQKQSVLSDALKHINNNSKSSLLLSATPEVQGEENFFHQLNFLDSNKFHSFDDFKKLNNKSIEVSKYLNLTNLGTQHKEQLLKFFNDSDLDNFKNDEEIKEALIDRYGTGRVYFRNSRTNLERFHRLFNDRILFPYCINLDKKINDKIVIDEKVAILQELLERYPEEKILAICHSKDLVQKAHRKLMQLGNYKIATFHSEQSLLERDRQAAFFADDDGAQLLICTEIGSEGRNFEFSHHLFLFDLPKLPDQLEQRIGRLDRIGQIKDINIHVPYIHKTFEEILFRWYDSVLNSFKASPKGAHPYYLLKRNELINLIDAPFSQQALDSFISTANLEYKEYCAQLAKGRNLLIEHHSYHHHEAISIVEAIEDYEQKTSPVQFWGDVCEHLGINFEEHSSYTHFVIPSDNMLIPSFPGLSQEGMTISFDRENALKYDNISFCSWEHPLIKNAFDFLLNSNLGNAVAIACDNLERNIYFEFIITAQCSDEYKHLSSTYMPFTPLRVLLDIQGNDHTKRYPKKFIDNNSAPLNDNHRQFLAQIPKDKLISLFKAADVQAKKRANKYINDAIDKVQAHFTAEKNRILSLEVDDKKESLEKLKLQESSLKQSIFNAKTSLDATRIILPQE